MNISVYEHKRVMKIIHTYFRFNSDNIGNPFVPVHNLLLNLK